MLAEYRNAKRLPLVYLAVSNPTQDLNELEAEYRGIKRSLQIAIAKKWIGDIVCPPRRLGRDDLLEPFKDRSRGQIAIFHFAGHANSIQLLLEGRDAAGQSIAANGLAQFLSTQFGLKLVFLNGCSTRQHAENLLKEARVDVVIATSRRIRDNLAKMFADKFYEELAEGVTVRVAFTRAEAQIQNQDFHNLLKPEFRNLQAAGNAIKQRAIFWGDDPKNTNLESGGWPWAIYTRQGKLDSAAWTLADLGEDPTVLLPPLPPKDPPEKPYPGFKRFKENDALVFFGRGQEIQVLYEDIIRPGSAPILLLYGKSGVGKSSLLDAGLLPRLKVSSLDSIYKRLDEQTGTISELLRSVLGANDGQNLLDAWRATETKSKIPLIIIIDQVEELFKSSTEGAKSSRDQFSIDVKGIFEAPGNRPRGKLILSFIKDYLPDVKEVIKNAGLAQSTSESLYIQALERDNVYEAIRLNPSLRNHFKLTINPDLAYQIAIEVTKESGLNVAPMLQILLTEMWDSAILKTYSDREFTETMFRDVQIKGYRLSEFLKRQMEKVQSKSPSAVKLGLLLDLLAAHTGPGGKALECKVEDLRKVYSHQSSILDDLIAQCKESYLLIDPSIAPSESGQRLRLAHDTLAPLVREFYEASPAPGQQARRILEARAVAWKEGKKRYPLDDADLTVVEKGARGMRDWQPAEKRLVDSSRNQRSKRYLLRILAIGLILVGAFGAAWQWWRAEVEVHENHRQLAKNNWSSGIIARDLEQNPAKSTLHLMRAFQYARLAGDNNLIACSELAGGLLLQTAKLENIIQLEGKFSKVMSWSKDEKRLLAGSPDGTVQVWDIKDNILIASFKRSPLYRAFWSRDERRILTSGFDGDVQVWDIHDQKTIASCKHSEGIVGAMWSNDDKRFLSWSDSTIQVWDINGNNAIATINDAGKVAGATFSRDDTRILFWNRDGKVEVRDIDGKKLTSFNRQNSVHAALWSKDENQILSWSIGGAIQVWDIWSKKNMLPSNALSGAARASWSNDGKRFLFWSVSGNTIQIWDIETNKSIATNVHLEEVGGALWSNDDKRLLSWDFGGTIQVWDIDGKKACASYRPLSRVAGVSWCKDNKHFLSWSLDGTVQVWHIDGSNAIASYRHLAKPEGALWGEDGKRILSWSADGTVHAWSIDGGKAHATYKHMKRINGASWSKDDKRFFSWDFDDAIESWDSESKKATFFDKKLTGAAAISWSKDDKRTLSWNQKGEIQVRDIDRKMAIANFNHQGKVEGVSWSRNDKCIFSWSSDGTIKVWTVEGNKAIITFHHPGRVTGVSWSKDNQRIFSWDSQGDVRIWNIANEKDITAIKHPKGAVGAAWSGDETHIVYWNLNGAIWIWDIDGNKLAASYRHLDRVMGASWSTDSKRILSWSLDGEVRVWDVHANKTIAYSIHPYRVNGASWSKDCKRILSWSADGTVQILDIETNKGLASFKHQQEVDGALWSKDEKRILSWSHNGTMLVWNLTVTPWLAHPSGATESEFTLQVEAHTGMTLDQTGALTQLPREVWIERKERLQTIMAPPSP